MSAIRIAERIAERMHRRRFLGKLGAVVTSVAASIAMVPVRIAEAAGCCTQCSDYNTLRNSACCSLGYTATCANMNCFQPNQNTWWYWGCCNGSALWSCDECCTNHCSKSVLISSTGCNSPAP